MRPKNPSAEISDFESKDQSGKIKSIISFALLAPSSHNSQPWLFHVRNNQIEVLKNPKRALAASDPTSREMHLSIGTAIQNILIAAEYFGYQSAVEFLDLGNTVAKITLSPSQPNLALKPLVTAMLSRHNNRFAYESRTPDQSFQDWLQKQNSSEMEVTIVTKPEEKNQIIEIVGKAFEEALNDYDFRQELSHWIKPSLNKYPDGMPGYNLAMPAAVSYLFPWILRHFGVGKFQRKMETKILKQTPTLVILSAPDNAISWIKTGIAFENIALHAEAAGLKVGVQAAAIEIGQYFQELKKLLGISQRPLMFFRLGYTSKIPKPSPRLSLEQALVE